MTEITMIEELEKKVKELDKTIKKYRTKIDNKHKKLNEYKEKINNDIKDIQKELSPYIIEFDKTTIELWKERGQQGLNHNIKYSDIPVCVRSVFFKIKDEYTQGCTGDWHDGCRDCDCNCNGKAETEWRNLFNITYS